MGRAPCCDKANVKKGPWSPEEDAKLKEFIDKFGTGGNWIALPQKAGLKRCGKSCRLRWLNYLRPNIKHGEFSDEEDRIICTLFASIGSRWSIIASQLPGRTDNDIKNYWNTKLKKKLVGMINPSVQQLQPRFFNHPPFSGNIQTTNQTHPFSLLCNPQPNYKTLLAPINNTISGPENCLPVLASNCFWEGSNLVDFQYYPLKDNSTNISNMLMFGGNEASCSSDGSCSQITYGKDHHVKQEEMGCQFQGYNSNNTIFDESNQKFILHYNGKMNGAAQDPLSAVFLDQGQKTNGIHVENHSQLEYDLEEVKQLISCDNGNNNSNNNNNGSCESMINTGSLFNDDNNKTHERGMYYYY